LGGPVALRLTAGQRGDVPQAEPLIAGQRAAFVLADGAYDAASFRDAIQAAGATAVIPNTPQRASKYPFDQDLYRERHLVECCFAKLKQFRRVATRYEKTARNYLAVVTLAAIVLWLK
jgi:transposase